MANDSTNKTNSSGNNSENKSLSTIDQQKVPPLRIVLNTAGNQRSSSATVTLNNSNNTNQHRKEKTQDVKSDVGTLKSGNKVRIKLGANKQQIGKGSGGSNSDQATRIGPDGAHKVRSTSTNSEKQDDTKEDSSLINQTHLRRITRRSQRAVQSVSNEDEESISSMTSIDENSNTNNTNNSDNNTALDTEQSGTQTTSTSTISTSTTSAANGSTNSETPRRYKRRKGEVSESLSIDSDSLFGSQNYKLPNQNSFELYKNIRKQVDKRLNSLTNVHPKTPHGFRDYMLTRGAYLLDGNKLGNGTNLFIGEDGGLHSTQLGKYHALKKNKVNYSIPNQAKVPLGLPVNSPLYDLFIEQERERYRMRMQHIKEREKLTLAAEQEIMRVYNHASLSAADQAEPFSACTMLKHQEIYNYLDSDGRTILSQEDSQREQSSKPDRVRTRRRPQDQVTSPQPPSKGSSEDSSSAESTRRGTKSTSTSEPQKGEDRNPTTESSSVESTGDEKSIEDVPMDINEDAKVSGSELTKSTSKEPTQTDQKDTENPTQREQVVAKESTVKMETSTSSDEINGKELSLQNPKQLPAMGENTTTEMKANDPVKSEILENPKNQPDASQVKSATTSDEPLGKPDESKSQPGQTDDNATPERALEETNKNPEEQSQSSSLQPQADIDNESQSPPGSNQSISDEIKRAQNREIFLTQLQEIDDKWERIRLEMLIRHRNEAESLYAIQKLEWEWKIKEIGACDIRTTPIIDSTLVPKLNIYYQDY